MMLKRLRTRLGLTSKRIAYSYRHTFATNGLKSGGSIKVLAELMGNSVAMIEQHYGHLDADRETMRKLHCAFHANEKARDGSSTLPAELVDRIVSLVKDHYGHRHAKAIANLRNLLSNFRVNGESEKTQTHQPQTATAHVSGS